MPRPGEGGTGREVHATALDADVREYLAWQRVGHVATASGDGKPHVVPICYALIDNQIVSVLDCKPKTHDVFALRRVRNIVENPRVTFLVDTYDEDWARLAYVLIHGTARIVEPADDPAWHARALAALRARYPQYAAMPLEDRPIVALTPSRATRWGNLTSRHHTGTH